MKSKVEMVQRQFIKWIKSIKCLPYPEQLKIFELCSLERRRDLFNYIFLEMETRPRMYKPKRGEIEEGMPTPLNF